MYLSESDVPTLLSHLNASKEIAFIVSNGPHKWIAVETLESLADGRVYCLWHVPSGPLPLFRGAKEAYGEIADPFAGWSEAIPSVDMTRPFFGPADTGVFWLSVRLKSKHWRTGETLVGLSGIEWIGNHYKIVGDAAAPTTERFWKALGRWVKKVAIKVPRCGPQERTQIGRASCRERV